MVKNPFKKFLDPDLNGITSNLLKLVEFYKYVHGFLSNKTVKKTLAYNLFEEGKS